MTESEAQCFIRSTKLLNLIQLVRPSEESLRGYKERTLGEFIKRFIN